MQNRNWLKSNFRQRQIFAELITLSSRKAPLLFVKLCFAVMLALLAASLSACGGTLPHAPDPVFPPKPAVSEPLPSKTHSSVAQDDIANWRKKLTGTPMTLKH